MFEPHDDQHALNLDALGFDELGRSPLSGAGHAAEASNDALSAVPAPHYSSSPAPTSREFLRHDFRQDDVS